MSARVLVAGAGSWGTALAIVLAKNGHHVSLWGHEADHISQLARERQNRQFLPDITFPDNIVCVHELQGSEQVFDGIVIAVPCHAVREVVTFLHKQLQQLAPVCLVCKGLEPETQLLCHDIVHDVAGHEQTVSILSGPSFAVEVANGLPTAVTIASDDTGISSLFSDLFHNDTFRVYTNNDINGVAIAGAVKNVLAIAAGIADGIGFGANTRAALITRGLAEIIRLGVALGGKTETFMGLSGLGDLVLTCTDDQSRNRRMGLSLARGLDVKQASASIGQAVEGVKTVREVCVLADRFNIEMPISAEVLKVINGESTPQQAVKHLLSRDPKPEQL